MGEKGISEHKINARTKQFSDESGRGSITTGKSTPPLRFLI